MPRGFCLGCPLVGGKVGPAHDGNCAYVMQQEAARKAHQEKYDKWWRPRVDGVGVAPHKLTVPPQVDRERASRREIQRNDAQGKTERSDQALPQVQTGDHEEPRVRPHDARAQCHSSGAFYAIDAACSTAYSRRCPCGHEFYWSTGKPYRTGLGGMFGGWMGGGGADY